MKHVIFIFMFLLLFQVAVQGKGNDQPVEANQYLQTLATFEKGVDDLLVKGVKWYDPERFSIEPSVQENPDKSGINDSDSCFYAETKASGWWGNFGELALVTPVIISEDNRFLRFQAYRTNQDFPFRIAVNGDHEAEVYIGTLSSDGKWETVVVDLGEKLMGRQLSSLVIVYNCDWSSGSAKTAVHAFDHFELTNVNDPVLSPEDISSLTITGDYYEIDDLQKGKQVFRNRDNMYFDDIPAVFDGWQYIRVSGRSSYNPIGKGEAPAFRIKASNTGYLYALMAANEQPANAQAWVSANGWELEPVSITFGANDPNKVFSCYKKQLTANVWYEMVFPDVFSRATIIAPKVSEDIANIPRVETIPVSILASGWMESSVLANGVIAYANRTYTFNSVSPFLSGLHITCYKGNEIPKLKVTALADGDLYIAQSDEDQSYDVVANGWTRVDDLEFGYNDPSNTRFTVYKKTVSSGEVLEIVSTGWQGVLVLSAEEIKYSIVTKAPTPPPGIVIHNSKANTKKFIGSPSIVSLEDGTYLASHDYFGTRTESFVYRSTDKGNTWERTANILDLKWASIFRRGNEVYLLGVRVDGTEYGNIVIFQSLDEGTTWTEPTNSSNGLLFEGHYHCAPMPVTSHKGKLWRGFESMATPNGWGPFGAFMLSVPEDADLLNAANWTKSNELQYIKGAVDAWTWLEGNAVVAKDGSMKDILRLHYGEDDRAAIINISEDGKTATFDPDHDIANISGASKKFTIRYDAVSDLYWTLSNHVLPKDKGGNLERTRNTIALSSSPDLKNWTVRDILLHVEEKAHHGFQYLDWLFEGDDIIAVSRTAWDDETGQADSQHNANFITFHRFKNFRYEKASSSNGIVARRWYQDAKSAIALTFDDGFRAHYEYAYPLLKEKGIPATFFVNSGHLVQEGETPIKRYGIWEEFKAMADDGYEIGSHSVSHPDLTGLDDDDLTNELVKDKDAIETHIGRACLTHAYPYCARNEDVDELISRHFIAGRACSGIQNNASLSGSEWWNVQSDLLMWLNPRSLENEQTSVETFRSNFENTVRRNRNFGVLCIHEVLPFDLLSTSDTYEIATTEWLGKVCDYLVEKRNSKDIWPATLADIVRYAQERDNLRIIKTEDDGKMEYAFTTWLDPDIFDHPVSIMVSPPEGWTKIKYEIFDGEDCLYEATHTAAEGKIDLDIIPDRQTLRLTRLQDGSGLAEPAAERLHCYPVPAKECLIVTLPVPVADGYCKIIDAKGATLRRLPVNKEQGGSFSLFVGDLPPGAYFIRINGGEESYSGKFVKK